MTDWLQHFRNRRANILDHNTYNHFALFVPLMKKAGEYHIIFEVRSQTIRQPGEICFPGGKVDDTDQSNEDAAIRELSEELGVDPTHVEIIGELDYMINPFKLMIYPFIGVIESDTSFMLNEAEVKEIFFVPVSKLLTMTPKKHEVHLQIKPEKNFPFHLIPNGENYNWRKASVTEQFYEYEGRVIWGLTARVLTHFIEEIKRIDQ